MRFYARFGLLLFGALLLPVATVCAHPSSNGSYSVRVENEWGRQLPTYHQGGQTYVLGGLHERYAIRVKNHTGTRVEAVVTVDGRDVISGERGDFVGERGYLIDPYGDVVIEGFRKSFDAVAAFRFSQPDASYSSRRGTPENVGVIGVAIFPERPRPRPRPRPIARPRPEYRSDEAPARPHASAPTGRGNLGGLGSARESAPAEAGKSSSAAEARRSRASAPSSAGAAYDDSSYEYDSYAPSPSTDNLGTEYGEALGSAAREVAFVRANATSPSAILTVRYDDIEGLRARGIEPYPQRPIAHATPDPFPRNRFAPPP